VVIIGFAMAACDTTTDPSNGNGNGNGNGNNGNPGNIVPGSAFSLTGKYNSKGTTAFQLAVKDGSSSGRSAVSGIRAAARAASGEVFEVEGKIQDGNTTLRLVGTYDSGTGKYAVSAGSSSKRYSITGSFDEDGNANEAYAMLAEKEGSKDWEGAIALVEEDDSAVVETEGESLPGGLPDAVLGTWFFNNLHPEVEHDFYYLMITPFKIITEKQVWVNTYKEVEPGIWVIDTDVPPEIEYEKTEYPIIKVEQKQGYIDIVGVTPLYIADRDDVVDAIEEYFDAKGYTVKGYDETEHNASDALSFDEAVFVVYDMGKYQGRDRGWKIFGDNWKWNDIPDDVIKEFYENEETIIRDYLVTRGDEPAYQLYRKDRIQQQSGKIILTSYGKSVNDPDYPLGVEFTSQAEAEALTETNDYMKMEFLQTIPRSHTVTNPGFEGWGGLGGVTGSTFAMVKKAENNYDCRTTYTFPPEASAYSKFTISFAIIKTADAGNKAKLIFSDRPKDNWAGDEGTTFQEYRDYDNDSHTYTHALSNQTQLTIAINKFDNANATADFNIIINAIRFHD